MLNIITLFYAAMSGGVLLPAMDDWNNPFKNKCYSWQGPGRPEPGP